MGKLEPCYETSLWGGLQENEGTILWNEADEDALLESPLGAMAPRDGKPNICIRGFSSGQDGNGG